MYTSLNRLIKAICIVILSTVFNAHANTSTTPVLSGAKIVNDNCSRCHNARPVQEFSMSEWRVIMPHMRERAHLTGEETQAVLAFFELVSEGDNRGKNVAEKPVSELSGQALITRYGCQGCHQVAGQGGTLGPALDNVVAEKGLAYFVKKVRDPQFNNPASTMPKMPISEAEAKAIAQFINP